MSFGSTAARVAEKLTEEDENRARVVAGNYIPIVMSYLSDPDMVPFAVPVLYNIMVDYEPAQLQACNAGLSAQLLNLLSGPQLPNTQAFINIICKIFGLLISQEPEPRTALIQTPLILLALAVNPAITNDVEDFISLTSVALAYLSHANLQIEFVAAGGMQTFLTVFATAQNNLDVASADADADLMTEMKQLRTALFNAIADLTGLPSFVQTCRVGSPIFKAINAWLMGSSPSLQAAACLALGNLCCSDELSVTLVKVHKTHSRLVGILSSASSPGQTPQQAADNTQLVHSVLSFLKNLAIPTVNKPILGEAGLFTPPLLPRIWSMDTNPQVQFAAVSLARLLLVGCIPNVRRLCASLSPDPQSPAHEATHLRQLIDVFDRADAEPTKLEAARAVASVCRVLHSVAILPVLPDWDPSKDESFVFKSSDTPPPSVLPKSTSSTLPTPSSTTSRSSSNTNSPASPPTIASATVRERFYARHENIMKPLAHLVTQPRWPALRSETWFVLALMARSREGARICLRVFQIHEAFKALMEAVTGRKLADSDLDGSGPLPVAIPPPEEKGKAKAAAPDEDDDEFSVGQDFLPSGLSLERLPPSARQPGQAEADMARVDRENCLVLVAEAVKQVGDEIPPLRKHYFESLLKEGGSIVATKRESSS